MCYLDWFCKFPLKWLQVAIEAIFFPFLPFPDPNACTIHGENAELIDDDISTCLTLTQDNTKNFNDILTFNITGSCVAENNTLFVVLHHDGKNETTNCTKLYTKQEQKSGCSFLKICELVNQDGPSCKFMCFCGNSEVCLLKFGIFWDLLHVAILKICEISVNIWFCSLQAVFCWKASSHLSRSCTHKRGKQISLNSWVYTFCAPS